MLLRETLLKSEILHFPLTSQVFTIIGRSEIFGSQNKKFIYKRGNANQEGFKSVFSINV